MKLLIKGFQKKRRLIWKFGHQGPANATIQPSHSTAIGFETTLPFRSGKLKLETAP